ncbi:hypothetical protein GSY69_00465 [Brevibacterium sp. 5221]|uniref:Uncharacterized protein n=1 Tax=Brevibacterium rongguiense TaxID=2695267 RepID=A0A6N9H3T0_9MICO|nr:hypothetical protein [Brevibacterium rongguiense]MYM18491.1 hypothetical protein [Brevibacterium rongguiense]
MADRRFALEPQPTARAPLVEATAGALIVRPPRGPAVELPRTGARAPAVIGFADLRLRAGGSMSGDPERGQPRRTAWRRCWFVLDGAGEPLAYLGGDPQPLYHAYAVKRFCARSGLRWEDMGIIEPQRFAQLAGASAALPEAAGAAARTVAAPGRMWLLAGLAAGGAIAGFPLMVHLLNVRPEWALAWVLGLGAGSLFAPFFLLWPMQACALVRPPRTVRAVAWAHWAVAAVCAVLAAVCVPLSWSSAEVLGSGTGWPLALWAGLAVIALLIPSTARAMMIARDPRTVGARSLREAREAVRAHPFSDFRPIGSPPPRRDRAGGHGAGSDADSPLPGSAASQGPAASPDSAADSGGTGDAGTGGSAQRR